MKKLCVFDLDGTLTNTLENLAYVTNEALDTIGAAHLEPELFKYFAGNGSKKLIERAMEYDKCDMSKFDLVYNTYMDKFKTEYCYLVKPYDGIVDTIKELKKKNIKLAVYSNKPHQMAVSVVEQVFGKGTFDLIIGQRDGYNTKPDPCGVYEAMEMFNVKEKDVLYMGDTNVDVETGHNANVFVIGVLWGFRPKEELEEAGADVIIDYPEEILNYLD